MLNPPPTKISDDSLFEYSKIISSDTSILCGRNNSGKSFILKQILQSFGRNANYLGPSRFITVQALNAHNPDVKANQFRSREDILNRNDFNVDNLPYDFVQAITGLTNSERKKLFNLMDDLLGTTNTHIAHKEVDNYMSQMYLSVDEYSMGYTSSGYRLMATMLTSLLDKDFKYILIDEPELGLSPEIQGILSDLILESEKRTEYFPHIEKVIISTHSPIFLDRRHFHNNFFIEKTNNQIHISPINNFQELNNLQFFLLGNRFETLFLPSVIILVEGESDYKFIDRVVRLRYPNSKISVIHTNNDVNTSSVLHYAGEMFDNLRKSPYTNRIIVVLDKKHQHNLSQKLTDQGIAASNIVVWSKNGIEYFYPPTIMKDIFSEFDEIEMNGDVISANGVSYKKNDLADQVVLRLTRDTKMSKEFEQKMLNKLDKMLY